MREYKGQGSAIISYSTLRRFGFTTRALTICLTWGMAIGCVHAEALRIVIVESGITERIPSFTEALNQRLGSDAEISVTTVSDLTLEALPNTFYIAVGVRAVRATLLKYPSTPVLGVYLTASEYREIAIAETDNRRQIVSAIFADPSPAAQLRLVRLLFPRTTSLGVLLGQQSALSTSELISAGKDNDVVVTVETVAGTDQLYTALAKLSNVDAILALPDNEIYNKDSFRMILLTAYRRGQVLIGFSPGMVKAGASATVNCGTEQVVDQAVRWISEFKHSGRLPSPRHCDYYDVVLNERVLSSLGMSPPPIDILRREFQPKGESGK